MESEKRSKLGSPKILYDELATAVIRTRIMIEHIETLANSADCLTCFPDLFHKYE